MGYTGWMGWVGWIRWTKYIKVVRCGNIHLFVDESQSTLGVSGSIPGTNYTCVAGVCFDVCSFLCHGFLL